MDYLLLNNTKLCYANLWMLLKEDDAVFADMPELSVREQWIYRELQDAIDEALHFGNSTPLYDAIIMPVKELVENGDTLVEPTLSMNLSFVLDADDTKISFPYIQYRIMHINK